MLRRADARAGVLSSAATADADEAMEAVRDERRDFALLLRWSLAALVGVSNDASESAAALYFRASTLNVLSSPWLPLPLPLRVRVTLPAIGD